MCFVEYNWTAEQWAFRIGDDFTTYRGVRYLPTLAAWREMLAPHGIVLVKTASRSYMLQCKLR